jgi:hypothetical protein
MHTPVWPVNFLVPGLDERQLVLDGVEGPEDAVDPVPGVPIHAWHLPRDQASQDAFADGLTHRTPLDRS